MSTVSELNKQKVRLFVEAVINQGRVELIDELLAVDYVGRMPCAELAVIGRAELRHLLAAHRLVHPDLYIKIEDVVAEDDLVAMRWRATGSAGAPGSARATGSAGPAGPAGPAGDSEGAPRWCGISVIRLLAGMQVDSYTALAPSASEVVT